MQSLVKSGIIQMGRLICYNMEELIEMKKVRKIIGRILLFMLVGLFLFVLGTFIFHQVKTKQALKLLKQLQKPCALLALM